MPRSSRSKSHKQSKHSSKEYSSSDEDVKIKERSSNAGKEDAVSVRVSKDSSVSGERRKHGKDLSIVHGNGGSDDRWNGGSSDDKGLVVSIDDKELLKSKDLVKTVGESKSKSSRRHGDDSAIVAGLEKDETKSSSGNRGEKRKSEKESSRRESSHHKEHKELKESKDKDHESDRGKKVNPDKLEVESSSKQVENQSIKKGKEIIEWPIEEELRNPELEKELEKRMRRRGEAYTDKNKYQDNEDKQLYTRKERSKDERHKNEEYGDIRETRKKDEKHREDGERDRKNRDVKHRGESGRYSKYRDDKYNEDKYIEDGNKESKYKDDKYMDFSDKEERSRDRKRRQDDDDDDDDDRDYKHKEEKRARDSNYRDLPEAKRSKDDNVGTDLYYRKTNNRDGSPVYDDRAGRYKDDIDRRRGNEKYESSDYRSRSSMKEQRSESEKRSSAKADSVSEWRRPSSRYEDRARDYDSAPGQSDKKVTSKDDGYMRGDLSGEKRSRPESRSFPQVDKSPSSTSNERRNLIKSDARKSLDLEEAGPQSGGSKDTVKDGKGSRELVNDVSQVDNDNLSVSSPYLRNSQFSGNSKSLLPPPSPSMFRTGSDGPHFGSTEDGRSRSNIRHRRMVDPNMNRGQSQNQSQGNWNNVPNWPSPMATGGYIPFQHVQPPMFHPLMQQYPPQIFGRPAMKINHGLPYHVSDHGPPLVPPPLHGWDANNTIFGDDSHLYGRLDWNQLSNRGWNQNAGGSMEVQSGQQKDGYTGHRSNDENGSGPTGQPDEGEPNQPDIQPEILNLDKNDPETLEVTESTQIFEVVKEDNEAVISHAYISRVDVSKDLTQPELFGECTSLMDLDPEALFDDFDCKILFLKESVDADVIDCASLFSVINDSVFQKAMFLYKKQKEEFRLMINSGDDVTADCTVKEYYKKNDEPRNKLEDLMDIEVESSCTVMEDSKKNDEPPNKVFMEPMNVEADPAVVNQEEEQKSTVFAVKESLAPSAGGEAEDARESTNDDKNGVLSDVSTADVAVMPTESVEFGSVNLNRIHHHSSESTH